MPTVWRLDRGAGMIERKLGMQTIGMQTKWR
jgi:hypothetical protein